MFARVLESTLATDILSASLLAEATLGVTNFDCDGCFFPENFGSAKGIFLFPSLLLLYVFVVALIKMEDRAVDGASLLPSRL